MSKKENFEMFTVGQKLKNKRKEVNAKQREIAGEFSRAYVSQVERGVSKLSPNAAKEFVRIINNIIVNKGLDSEFITVEYLLEDLESQLNNNLCLLKGNLERYKDEEKTSKFEDGLEILDEIQNISDNIDIDNLYEIYDFVIEYYYKRYMYSKSKIYVDRAIILTMQLDDNEKKIKYLVEKLKNNYRLKEYDEIIVNGNLILNIMKANNLMNTETLMQVYMDIALSYWRKSKYDKCLETINKIECDLDFKMDVKLQIGIFKASCFLKLEDFQRSERIYRCTKNLALECGDAEIAAQAIEGIALVNHKTGKLPKAKKNIIKAMEFKIERDSLRLGSLYANAVEIYIDSCETKEIKETLIKTMNYMEITNEKEREFEIIEKSIDYFIKENDNNSIKEILRLIKEKVYDNKINYNNISDFFFIGSEYFREINELESYNLYRDGLNIIKHFKKNKKNNYF